MRKREDEVYANAIEYLIRLLSKLTGRLNRLIGDLQYHLFLRDFGHRDDDIWVVTYMKSGTTLTQMILYQLTTEGSMEFRHINDVCPWVRNAAVRGLKPANIPSPRILKSHDPYNAFDSDTKGRFIFVMRDGMDVAASYYHHRKNYNNPDLQFSELFTLNFEKKGQLNWFTFTSKWLENKNRFPILYLKYEDMLSDFDGVLEKIIRFCNLDVNDQIIHRVKERCSFSFMKKHEEKFGIERMEERRILDQFIRKGRTGDGKEVMTTEQLDSFKANYDKSLKSLTEKRGLPYDFLDGFVQS